MSARALRILLVVNDMGYGGAEVQVAELARRYARAGHVVKVVALVRFIDLEPWIREAGVETEALGMHYGRLRPADLWRWSRTVRAFRPDVVHAHLSASILVARVGRLLAQVPVVVSTSHAPFELPPRRYPMFRVTDRLDDLWTNVCREGVRTFVAERAVSARKAELASNGIDLARFAPSADVRARVRAEMGAGEDELVWLTVGSFRSEQKDYDNLLHALALVLRSQPHVRAWLAGEGALLPEKQRLAERLGIADHVRFLGLRKDVHDLMRAADGFVMGSAWEAFPIVLLEASASALPIVTTDVGDNGRIVGPEGGILVPPKSAERLADAMIEVGRRSAAERHAMGQAGRARVEREFEMTRVADRWVERYRALLVARGARW